MFGRYLLFIFVLSICFANTLAGQRLSYKKYTKEDGLLQTEIGGAAILHDSTIIVIDGSKTLKRFDGYKFRPFPGWDDVPSYSSGIFNFKKYNVFRTSGKYYLYADGQFSALPIYVKDIDLRGTSIVNEQFIICSIDSIFIYDHSAKKITSKVLPDYLKKYNNLNQVYTINFTKAGDKVSVVSYDFTVKKWYDVSTEKEIEGTWPERTFFWRGPKYDLPVRSIEANFSYNFHILNSSGSKPGTKNFFSSVSKDERGNLLELTSDTIFAYGVLPQEIGAITAINNQTLLNHGHNGLYRLNPNIHFFPAGGEMVSALHTIMEDHKGTIWFGSYGYGFSYFDEQLHKFGENQQAKVMPGGINAKDGSMYFSNDGYGGGCFRWKGGKDMPERIGNDAAYVIRELKNGQIAFGKSDQRMIVLNNKKQNKFTKIIDKNKGIGIPNILDIEEDNRGRLWMIGRGVDLYDASRDTAFHFAPLENDARALAGMTLEMDDQGTMWFGTKNGLFYLKNASAFDPEKSNIQHLAKKINFPNNDQSNITSLLQIDHYMIIGSNKGVSFLDLKSFYKNSQNPVIYQLEYGEGIEGGGSEQNCLYFDTKRRLWIGSQEGATMIDWDRYEFDRSKSRIKLEKVEIGDEPHEVFETGSILLPTKKRNLSIEFGLDKNLSLLKNVYFDYALVSNKGDTIVGEYFDQNGVLEIKYLPPGNYNLNITAFKHGQIMDEMSIVVTAPLSLEENPLTWASLSLALIGLFAFIFLNKSKQQKIVHDKELALGKMTAEASALRVQSIISTFNPHFINNSLYWIQSKHMDDGDTVKMVDRLSKNIRYIFHNTRAGKAVHTFKEEMNLVKNYLEVQKLRYGDKYDFRIPNEEQLQKFGHVQMIIMQIQIHFENAIEHGLRNNEGGGYVSLNIDEDLNNYYCLIEDNGVGRERAKALGFKGTQMGTHMLEELHQLYNALNTEHIKQVYDDDIFTHGTSRFGTRVRLKIPKKFEYKLS